MEITIKFSESKQARFTNDCVMTLNFTLKTWSVGPTSRTPFGDPTSRGWPTQIGRYTQSGAFEVKDNGVIWIWDSWATVSTGMVPEKHNSLIIRDAPISEADTIHGSGTVRIYDAPNSAHKDVVVSWTRTGVGLQPSLTDKKGFFPGVLRNADFQKKGILFGEEASIGKDCKWVVIDPGRHKLAIWEKSSPTADFPTEAQALKASVFTNGPLVYARTDGNQWVLGATYIAKGISNTVVQSFSKDASRPAKQGWDKAADEVFGGPPYGNVVGFSRNVNATAPPAGGMVLGYFGRGGGTDFDSYKIGIGNPVGLAEASGGLYAPAILNSKVTPDSHGSNQWFYWGLAPLKAEGADEADLKSALAAYSASSVAKPVTGLIIGFFYHSGGGGLVQHLADVGVRDAVKLDGGDSVLFGHEDALLWGDSMSGKKRIWMRWGFAFFPY